MNLYSFRKGSLLLAVCLLCRCLPAGAQESAADSLSLQATEHPCATDGTHRLGLREVLVPTAVFGASACFVAGDWAIRQKQRVQDALSAGGRHKFRADDYSQYAPFVVAYGLDFCGVPAKHGLKDRTLIFALSYATMGVLVNAMKWSFREKRPDTEARNSFPSGHTATAFMGASLLYREYRDVSPWIGYAGYAVAAATGYLRIYNNRHYLNDVLAGACVGILSTRLAYWLYPKIFRKSGCRSTQKPVLAGMPYYADGGMGMNLCLLF